MIAKPIHSFFIRALLCRCRHKPPDRGFDSKHYRDVALESRERLMSHMESSYSNITVVQRVTPALRVRVCPQANASWVERIVGWSHLRLQRSRQ
jgi:hypothetical protein